MPSTFNGPNVSVTPFPVQSGGKIHIQYHGLLKNSGANEVFLHFGYDGWKDKSTVGMNRSTDGNFVIDVNASADQELNFCFKDNADHWDDNNGWNWFCEIE